MKNVFVILVVMTFQSLGLGSTVSSPPVECYKLAMSDSAVLSAEKYADKMSKTSDASHYAVILCAGALTSEGPIACYKEAMTDPAVLVDEKIVGQSWGMPNASSYAVKLCSSDKH